MLHSFIHSTINQLVLPTSTSSLFVVNLTEFFRFYGSSYLLFSEVSRHRLKALRHYLKNPQLLPLLQLRHSPLLSIAPSTSMRLLMSIFSLRSNALVTTPPSKTLLLRSSHIFAVPLLPIVACFRLRLHFFHRILNPDHRTQQSVCMLHRRSFNTTTVILHRPHPTNDFFMSLLTCELSRTNSRGIFVYKNVHITKE